MKTKEEILMYEKFNYSSWRNECKRAAILYSIAFRTILQNNSVFKDFISVHDNLSNSSPYTLMVYSQKLKLIIPLDTLTM